MRVLVPDHVRPARLAEVQAVSGGVEVTVLRIERTPWARALRVEVLLATWALQARTAG